MSLTNRLDCSARQARHRAALLLGLGLSAMSVPAQAQVWTSARDTTRSPARADSLRLSLDTSISIALKQATPIQLAMADERVAAARVLSAYGQFLPAAATGVSAYNEQGTALLSQSSLLPYDATFHGAVLGFSTALTLFDGLRDRAGLRAAIARRDAADMTLARAREEIANDVSEAYYRVVLDDRLSRVARANLELSRNRLAQLAGQVAAGMKAPPDLYRQQALTREDEAAVIASETRGTADRISLLRRLRLDPTRPVAVMPDIPDSTAAPSDSLDVTQLSRMALSQRPDLAAAGDERRASEAAITAAHGALLPRVALEFDVVDAARIFSRQQQNGVDLLGVKTAPAQSSLGSQLGHQVSGIVSLGVSMPLFDRWQTRAEVERAQALAERSRLAEEDLHDRVIGEVAQAVDEIRSSARTLDAASAQAAAAQKAYDAVSGRYEVGMATFIDVATAQTELARARNSVEAAVVSRALARQHLATALGSAPETTR
jgi:outer membrane protein